MTTQEILAESADSMAPIDVLFHSLRGRRERLRRLLGSWKAASGVLPVFHYEKAAIAKVESILKQIDSVLNNEMDYRHIDREDS